MGTTKKPDKDDKKQKTAPKTAQNKPKTREALARKTEPPRAVRMMQAHGKAKLVRELQEQGCWSVTSSVCRSGGTQSRHSSRRWRKLRPSTNRFIQSRRQSLTRPGKCRHVRFPACPQAHPYRKHSLPGQSRPGGLLLRRIKRLCNGGLPG